MIVLDMLPRITFVHRSLSLSLIIPRLFLIMRLVLGDVLIMRDVLDDEDV